MIELAKKALVSGAHSVAVARAGELLAVRDGEGLRPLLSLYRELPELFKESAVADKVIGKAAACVLVSAGVREVYGQIMSVSAVTLLEQDGIRHSCGELVEFITNRRGDGMCPLEQSVLASVDAKSAFESLSGFLASQK